MMMFGGQHNETEPGGSKGPIGSDIVPAQPQTGASGRRWLWFVGIGLSVAVMGQYPMLGIMCLAMGLRIQSGRFGAQGFLLGLGIVAGVFAVWSVTDGISSAAFAIPPILVSAAIAVLMWRGRATVTSVSLVVVAVVALSMAMDAFTAASMGTNLAEATTSMLVEVARASVDGGVQADLALATIEPVLGSLWPMAYVLTVVMDVAAAGFGSFLGSVKRPEPMGSGTEFPARPRVPQISRFDAPLWSVGVLALSVLGIGASFVSFAGADMVRTVALTLFMSTRIIFVLQGLGVALGLMSRWRMGCFGRVAFIMLAVWLEMMFVLSIIGLIDVWANFRKLPREAARTEAHS